MTTCPQCGYVLSAMHVHPGRKQVVYGTYHAMSLTWDGKIHESIRNFTPAQGWPCSISMGDGGYSYDGATRLLNLWNNRDDMYSLYPFTDAQRDAFQKLNAGRKRG